MDFMTSPTRKLINVFEIQALIRDGQVTPKKTIFSSKYGPLKLIRFDMVLNALHVVMEDARGKSYVLGYLELKNADLRVEGDPVLRYEKWIDPP